MLKQYVLTKSQNQTKAVRAKCKDCIYDSLSTGSELDQITNCISTDCALWEWRPLSGKVKTLRKEELINLMSPTEKANYLAKADLARENMRKNLHSS